jgi:nucleoside-diphosphate-sugar epimerase
MQKMKVLVTGSAGLIGRWVCEKLLDEGHEVIGIDILPAISNHDRYKHYQLDILDKAEIQQAFQTEQPAGLIHLADRCDLDGKSIEDYEANRQGVQNICSAVHECGSVRKAIYTSTQLVCEIGHKPVSDTDFCPTTPYGESKVSTEEIVRE